MLEKREKYDPLVYGVLRSEFLNKLDSIPSVTVNDTIIKEEKKRQELIEEIRKGNLVAVRH